LEAKLFMEPNPAKPIFMPPTPTALGKKRIYYDD
jgi:hypothetical protein